MKFKLKLKVDLTLHDLDLTSNNYNVDRIDFFLAPFSGKVLAIFEEKQNISLIVKLDSEISIN